MADVNPGRSGMTGRLSWPVRRRVPGPEGTAEDIAVQDIAEREAADRSLPPPDPEPMMEPPPRFNLAAFRLAGLALALVLVLGLAIARVFIGGPPSIAQLRAQAGVDGWTELAIGVKDDQPGVAYYNKKKHQWSGFDIDIAYMIAEDLGFRQQEVKFFGMESEDRARMQATDPADEQRRVPVKMVISSYSITDERKAMGVVFSEPYLYTEQSVVTRKGHAKVSTFTDLQGKKVCSLSTSTSANALTRAGATVLSKNRVSECFDLLTKHEVEAISTDAAILAGYKALDTKDEIEHWDLGLDSSEKWGVNVGVDKAPATQALQTLVDVTLYKSWKDPHDERWERAFENLQSEIDANLPTPIAVATQPPVARPNVRQLPWENDLP
jgi:glutamate transport system substrate-binding protein